MRYPETSPFQARVRLSRGAWVNVRPRAGADLSSPRPGRRLAVGGCAYLVFARLAEEVPRVRKRRPAMSREVPFDFRLNDLLLVSFTCR
jgi:hypothetical protein